MSLKPSCGYFLCFRMQNCNRHSQLLMEFPCCLLDRWKKGCYDGRGRGHGTAASQQILNQQQCCIPQGSSIVSPSRTEVVVKRRRTCTTHSRDSSHMGCLRSELLFPRCMIMISAVLLKTAALPMSTAGAHHTCATAQFMSKAHLLRDSVRATEL